MSDTNEGVIRLSRSTLLLISGYLADHMDLLRCDMVGRCGCCQSCHDRERIKEILKRLEGRIKETLKRLEG